MTADPAAVPPPEWAVNIALEEFDKDLIDLGFVDRLARLLASVREGALREAVCASEVSCGCGECEDAILSLLHTPPSGGAG